MEIINLAEMYKESYTLQKEMDNLYKNLLETALQAGIEVIPEERCYQLLAWLYVMGGGNEASTHNQKLLADIMYVQKKFNIYGGEVASIDREKIKSLCNGLKNFCENKSDKPLWLSDFEKIYNLKTSKKL